MFFLSIQNYWFSIISLELISTVILGLFLKRLNVRQITYLIITFIIVLSLPHLLGYSININELISKIDEYFPHESFRDGQKEIFGRRRRYGIRKN